MSFFSPSPMPPMGQWVESEQRRRAWMLLSVGQAVSLTKGRRPPRRGVIECVTPDGKVIWIKFSDSEHSLVFHCRDDIVVQIIN